MRKKIIFIFLILIILGGFNRVEKSSSDSLIITQEDEKAILEYLDAYTNYIINPSIGGKIYNAFTVLGTDIDKIYLWVLKEEYLKQGSESIMGSGVSLPIVLYIINGENGIEIANHKYPEGDASELNMNIKKLFPKNIRRKMGNQNIKQLNEIIIKRVNEEFNEFSENRINRDGFDC